MTFLCLVNCLNLIYPKHSVLVYHYQTDWLMMSLSCFWQGQTGVVRTLKESVSITYLLNGQIFCNQMYHSSTSFSRQDELWHVWVATWWTRWLGWNPQNNLSHVFWTFEPICPKLVYVEDCICREEQLAYILERHMNCLIKKIKELANSNPPLQKVYITKYMWFLLSKNTDLDDTCWSSWGV